MEPYKICSVQIFRKLSDLRLILVAIWHLTERKNVIMYFCFWSTSRNLTWFAGLFLPHERVRGLWTFSPMRGCMGYRHFYLVRGCVGYGHFYLMRGCVGYGHFYLVRGCVGYGHFTPWEGAWVMDILPHERVRGLWTFSPHERVRGLWTFSPMREGVWVMDMRLWTLLGS